MRFQSFPSTGFFPLSAPGFVTARRFLYGAVVGLMVCGDGLAIEIDTGSADDISDDGRFVVFETFDQLVPEDTDGSPGGLDIYIRDRQTGTVEFVSQNPNGAVLNGFALAPSVSADGQQVAFVYVPRLSDGGDDYRNTRLYVRDRVTGTTELLQIVRDGRSIPLRQSDGEELLAPLVISGNGRYVAFPSDQPDLVADDTNDTDDMFLFDRQSDSVERVNLTSAEEQIGDTSIQSVSINSDGRFVTFTSGDPDLIDGEDDVRANVFVRDRQTGITETVSIASDGSRGNAGSSSGSLSSNGRFVAFSSSASNLVLNDTNEERDIFVHDRQTDITERVSVTSTGEQANDSSEEPSISGDGSVVMFSSLATNLYEGDTADVDFARFGNDIFVHDRSNGSTIRINVDRSGESLELDSEFRTEVFTDGTGRYAVFRGWLVDLGDRCDVTAADNRYTIGANEYHLLALPCDPPPGTTIGSLFGDNIDGDYGDNYRVFTYDTSLPTPDYVNPGVDGRLRDGEGFWLIHSDDAARTLDLPVGSRQAASDPSIGETCGSPIGCRRIALTGLPAPASSTAPRPVRWSMQGNPTSAEQAPVSFDELRVTTETGVCASTGGCDIDAAFTSAIDVLVNRLFTRQGGGAYEAITSGDTLEPWEGLWVGELPGAEGNGPTLLFPER